MRTGKSSRGRSSASDRGGIRKRGPTRLDRDGDLDMDGGGRGRGKRGKDSGRQSQPGGRPQVWDKTLDAIHQAMNNGSGNQANVRQAKTGGSHLEQVNVRGWKRSRAASNRDGGLESLLGFLERRLNASDSKSGPRAKISKSRVEGDALVASIRPELVDRLLKLSGVQFAGARLTIEPYSKLDGMINQSTPNGDAQSTTDTKAQLTAFLARRYFQDTKLLNLSLLRNDPDVMSMGIFDSMSTESKFFPALMKVWEMNVDHSAARREAVESVSLADNQLTNISPVTTLAQTFPDVKNLDLSNNNVKDAQSLLGWRWKFRNLELLNLNGNPFSADPTFKDTMLKWYPKLRYLNNTEVRTAEEVAAQKRTPIPVQPPHFQDDSQIAENFIRAFFVGYDNDRNDLLNGVYDSRSTFSLSVNPSAPRAQQTETAGWDAYIKKSRNLLKINYLPARMSRCCVGVDRIREMWKSLPQTRHPDVGAHPEEWLIECHHVPGLPDPSGQSATGVGGLMVMVHGKFEELNSGKVDQRSFDRTFIIGPGGGVGGIRVISDMLCLRAYGGHEAWTMESHPVPQPQPAAQPSTPEGYGMPAPGKPDSQVQQEQLVVQMSSKTTMTLQYSEMALSGNGWNMDAALKNFEELKTQGKLPPDAFITGTTLQ